jgi:hypothetical protein
LNTGDWLPYNKNGKLIRGLIGKPTASGDGFQPSGPAIDIAFERGLKGGRLFATDSDQSTHAHNGPNNGSRIIIINRTTGHVTPFITGLPTGDHPSEQLAFKGGWIYWSQGSTTNCGVVGLDNGGGANQRAGARRRSGRTSWPIISWRSPGRLGYGAAAARTRGIERQHFPPVDACREAARKIKGRGRRTRCPAPLLDARGYRGDLGIRVGLCIFGIRDQPIDRPALDLVGRPRPLISRRLSRAGARQGHWCGMGPIRGRRRWRRCWG